ncbi:MAG TPA: nuclear transport factor 2 family protein [Solirubrobacterales bacterium]|jgi:ketosteroid isomerase-like protein|nr:nuclear transport factor 2 family protein [Solirubrobacterales bacterium]
MNEQTSAAKVARAAMAAVQDRRRDDWLDHFAADARVEDPVGHLPPLIGREALAAFWDNAIAALASTRFEVSREWETDGEALLLATVTIATAGGAGAGAGASYDGAFNYALDNDGRIASLRAFWDLPAVGAALAA